jgi:hypothetical protein
LCSLDGKREPVSYGVAMNPISTYWMWTTGSTEVTLDVGLDWRKSYLITGYLTLTQGDDRAHVYIATLCTLHGDQELCGLRDVGDDFGLSVTEFVSSATSVTIKLRTQGGAHRAEGVVYEL